VRKGIANIIYVKNAAVWAVISCCCVIAVGTFVNEFYKDLSAGKEIFLPGAVILAAAVLGLLVFGITRIIKYIKLLRQNG
jgi:hypothetical protein